MQFIEINIPSQVKNEALRERVVKAQSGRSREFILVIDGIESAFVSFEDWSDRSLGFIYEIFVLPNFRGQGLGSKLLSHAEQLARKLNCTRLQLEANAFDRTTSQEHLTSWYTRKGYLPKVDDFRRLEKSLEPE
jgi:GNAT superfamily N-acetyltransferase